MDGSQKVVLLIIQYVIRESHTRRHQFSDASFHELLRQLRILKLVADGHTLTCTDQFRQIGIEGMMGESRHLIALTTSSVITMGEGDT